MTSICITKRGARLSVKNGMFHILAEKQENVFALDSVKEISISKSTTITSDAILVAAENGIDIIFVLRNGTPRARVWNNKFGSIATVRKNQLVFAQSNESALWIGEMLKRKLHNQVTLLSMLTESTTAFTCQKAIDRITESAERIGEMAQAGKHIDVIAATLRGIEGKAGVYYFRSLSKALPEQYAFAKRSSQPAQDMFNALLNYAYGILYSKVETALLKAGIDPAIGVMHRDEYNRPVFTYDFIEPYRIWAEVVVTNLCTQEVIYADFFESKNGGFWLNDYGKKILISSIYDYMNELIVLNSKSRSRIEHLNTEARDLATRLRTLKTLED